MDQEVIKIDIAKLVLWTENPRDPIDPSANDQDVIDNALDDKRSQWTLPKLAKEMGEYYDFSELPTVVYKDGKPVVYDGNRRMILAKLKHKLVKVDHDINLPDIPKKIPCNVCSEPIAFQNIYRKHADSGSWSPLDRDIFVHKFLKRDQTILLKLEENTNIITAKPFLNIGFVKKEVFTLEKLKNLGFDFNENKMVSRHSTSDSKKILNNLSEKVYEKEITTRKNRGKVYEVLDEDIKKIIQNNSKNELKDIDLNFPRKKHVKKRRKTQRSRKPSSNIFGGDLILKSGPVGNVYIDIVDLYTFYVNNKRKLSDSFPSLIRMSLRLLCETTCNDLDINFNTLIQNYFTKAKKALNQDQQTTLSSQNVRKENFIQLLQIGAHPYEASKNIEQTIAMSLIIGNILTLTHGKN